MERDEGPSAQMPLQPRKPTLSAKKPPLKAPSFRRVKGADAMLTLKTMNEWLETHKSHRFGFVRRRWPGPTHDEECSPLPDVYTAPNAIGAYMSLSTRTLAGSNRHPATAGADVG